MTDIHIWLRTTMNVAYNLLNSLVILSISKNKIIAAKSPWIEAMDQIKTESKLKNFWKKLVAILTDQVKMFESYEKLYRI